ncbi:MAG: M48 family metalloprotease [Blastocatellia bacterium]
MQRKFLTSLIALLILTTTAGAGTNDAADGVLIDRVRRIMEEVRTKSFAELQDVEIRIKLFDSDSDYFQTRFTLPSALFSRRLHYLLKVNRQVFAAGASEEGLRAIIAHELGHILYFQERRRLQLLGLVRLACRGYASRFERGTDLIAIARGYGEGLKIYRRWLYQNIPARKLEEKRRNYFTPEEIDAVPR